MKTLLGAHREYTNQMIIYSSDEVFSGDNGLETYEVLENELDALSKMVWESSKRVLRQFST